MTTGYLTSTSFFLDVPVENGRLKAQEDQTLRYYCFLFNSLHFHKGMPVAEGKITHLFVDRTVGVLMWMNKLLVSLSSRYPNTIYYHTPLEDKKYF